MQDDNNKMNKGKGWHGDPEGHSQAGRKGGEKTKEEMGPDFYKQIGHMGGQVSPTKFKPGDERAREAGRKGGESRGKSSQMNKKMEKMDDEDMY